VFTEAWAELLETGGVKCVPIPAQSPNCNPHAERFVKPVRTGTWTNSSFSGNDTYDTWSPSSWRHCLTERSKGSGSNYIPDSQAPSRRRPRCCRSTRTYNVSCAVGPPPRRWETI
jgi:hypothetical protein